MEGVTQSVLLPPVQIDSHLQGSRELKLQKQAKSEPADTFCVLDEGLNALKHQRKQRQNNLR